MGSAREAILLQYKLFERQKAIAKVNMENRQAIVAAGIYQDPINYLNEAANKYAEMVYLNTDTKSLEAQKAISNQELFEEWKRIFGKIDENESTET